MSASGPGSGFRLYFRRTGADDYTLVWGGTEATQTKDIKKAKGM